MEAFTNLIDKSLTPFANKLAGNKYLTALSHGLMATLPILIFGSVCIIIADFPVPIFQEFMLKTLGNVWTEWAWEIVVPSTIGLMSLLAIVGVTNSLCEQNHVNATPAIVISICSFFVLLVQTKDGGFSASDFEARGLFMAIITAVICAELYAFLIKHDIRIKMPKGVPDFVSNQFSAIIPAAIIIPIFLIVRLGFEATSYGTFTNFLIDIVQKPLVGIGSTLIGTTIASFFNTFFWFFGIHGTAVVGAVMDPLWYAAQFENLEIFKQGESLIRPFIGTMDYANFFIYLGGTGLTFPLTLLMAFKCRSQRLKDLGKLSMLPGFFNVNEPVIFGLPIVLNPMMLIPFVLAPLISILVSWLAMSSGLVPYPTGVTIPWTTPVFIGGWLMTSSWKGGMLQIIVSILSGCIYYPFITTLDRQYLADEKELEEPEESVNVEKQSISVNA
ncbi:MAG: PTS sugar transporter subunit IIC [Enterococcus malodoratus]|uniref:PTS sugar transporter subunit IIC n=1 Tax=Enterococcus malodoratus TaxID=71451 RepID=UPI002073DD55|nr:PTS transporter subunit EIIC [Enterococcus malodoratus]